MNFSAEYIEAEYQRRTQGKADKCWGWSFMYVPQERLHTAKVMLVGLNPGGRELNPPINEWHYEAGINAYVDEAWAGLEAGQHPLQQQVSLLFEAMGVDASEVFAANFVPFRSPSWRDLDDPIGALEFSQDLWRHMISLSPARLFLSLGKEAGRQVAAVTGSTYQASYPVGWGRQTIDAFSNDQGQIVLSLPHLSRFRVFGNGRTQAAEVVQRTVREMYR
ncbi:hypothetical protein [Brevundimonas sp.]|uniref:hypothetical protein n=1 Tax=Brevundimonas sp. TaxID=1871086 RepID=UPI00289A9AC3|nr:hypothetical protein [Brevundimonas sp.]